MNAYKCDACGKIYLLKRDYDDCSHDSFPPMSINLTERFNNNYNYNIKSYDICSDCAKKILAYIKEIGEENGERFYRD